MNIYVKKVYIGDREPEALVDMGFPVIDARIFDSNPFVRLECN